MCDYVVLGDFNDSRAGITLMKVGPNNDISRRVRPYCYYNPELIIIVIREFLFVDDIAEAVVFALENKLPEHLYNVGSGKDITIKQLAETVQNVTDVR